MQWQVHRLRFLPQWHLSLQTFKLLITSESKLSKSFFPGHFRLYKFTTPYGIERNNIGGWSIFYKFKSQLGYS